MSFSESHFIHAVYIRGRFVLAQDVPASQADRPTSIGAVSPHARHDNAQATIFKDLGRTVHHHIDRGLVSAYWLAITNLRGHVGAGSTQIQVLSTAKQPLFCKFGFSCGSLSPSCVV